MIPGGRRLTHEIILALVVFHFSDIHRRTLRSTSRCRFATLALEVNTPWMRSGSFDVGLVGPHRVEIILKVGLTVVVRVGKSLEYGSEDSIGVNMEVRWIHNSIGNVLVKFSNFSC
jgi:hypothetical protein